MLRLHQDSGIILQALSLQLNYLPINWRLSFLAAVLKNTIPVFISLPAKPGFCYALIKLNDNLAPAIKYGTQLQTKAIEKF